MMRGIERGHGQTEEDGGRRGALLPRQGHPLPAGAEVDPPPDHGADGRGEAVQRAFARARGGQLPDPSLRRQLLVLVLGSALVALSAPGATAGTLYVTNRGSGTLAILDESSLAVRATIPVGERPWGVGVTAVGRRACVSYAGGLAVVNLEARVVERRVARGGPAVGRGARGAGRPGDGGGSLAGRRRLLRGGPSG